MKKQSRYLVIIGCGQLGSHLANELSLAGDSVVVIDRNERSFENLSSDFSGFRIEGDATRVGTLKEARLEKADVVVAVSGSDNVNIMVAQVARSVFGIKHTVARVYEQNHQELCEKMGVRTICTTRIAAEHFLQEITGQFGQGRASL